MEVDWSGPTMTLDDNAGGLRKVYLFVGCLPFSRYAFVYATWDMSQSSWLRAHVAMFEAFGGLGAKDRAGQPQDGRYQTSTWAG